MNRFLMVTLGLMIASSAMAADLTPSFPSGGINPSRGIYGGMVTGLTITAPGAYAPSDLPVTLSIDGNQSGERARASVTAYTAVSARVASAGSGCSAGAIYSYGATGTKIIVSDGNGLSGSTVSVVSGGTGNASAIPANPVSMTAVKSSCTPPKLNLSWGVQSVSLDNQGWGYASPPSGTGSVSMAPDAAIAMVSTTVQTGVVSLPDKLVAASRVGAAGGVAGLDGGGNVTSNINSTILRARVAGLSSDGSASPVLSEGGVQSSYKLPGQDNDPWVNPHALWVGAQRSGAASSVTGISTDSYGTGSSVVLRGVMDGPIDLGCLICVAQTSYPVMSSRAPISGSLSDPTQIPKLPSFDSAIYSNTGGSIDPVILLENVTYDSTHIYMPGCGPTDAGTCVPLSKPQMARIHPNMYVTTNSIDPDIPQHGYVDGQPLDIANYYAALTTGEVSSDGKSVSVYGWGVLNGASYNHPWSSRDVPGTTYDTIRNNYGHSEVGIGSPTGMEVENSYITIQPDDNPASMIRYATLKEWNFHYAAANNDAGTMMGIVLAYDCSGKARPNSSTCKHPTTNSTALTINGTNLPNGIQVTVPGWANEYKGYNFYIPGSNAAGTGTQWSFATGAAQGNIHTAFESFTPVYRANNQLVLRSWVEQFDATATPTWKDYSYNIGMVIDGTRWDPSGASGTHMGLVSFNWNSTNLGGVCLVNNQNANVAGLSIDDPGVCVRGDGTFYAGYAATFDSSVTIGKFLNVAGNVRVENGNSLILTPYGGTASSAPYFAASGVDTVFLTTSGSGNTATLQAAKFKAVTSVSSPVYYEKLTTPASSTSACTAGQFTDDANYHYVCVATNQWKRVALESW